MWSNSIKYSFSRPSWSQPWREKREICVRIAVGSRQSTSSRSSTTLTAQSCGSSELYRHVCAGYHSWSLNRIIYVSWLNPVFNCSYNSKAWIITAFSPNAAAFSNQIILFSFDKCYSQFILINIVSCGVRKKIFIENKQETEARSICNLTFACIFYDKSQREKW